MSTHTQTGIARYVSRAQWWRAELATAATPAEQFKHAQRWLHALARQAEQTGRAGAAEDAFTEAATALADICQRLERRAAPGREVWGP